MIYACEKCHEAFEREKKPGGYRFCSQKCANQHAIKLGREELLPSKERCNCPNGSYGIKHTTLCYEEQLATARRTAEYWKAEHLAGNRDIDLLRQDCRRWENAHKILLADNERLRKQVGELSVHAEKWVKRALTPAHEREMPHCSTCACPPYEPAADRLESEEFYETMQAYRHAPVSDQAFVVERFEAVKAFIRSAQPPEAGQADENGKPMTYWGGKP